MKIWRMRETIPAGVEEALAVFPEVLRPLLHARGFANETAARLFLEPDYERDLHDPFLLKDMDRAVARIIKAIQENEKVAIYADYDADGVPGATVISSFFKKIGFDNFLVYIPDRHTEAYGLNNFAMGVLVKKKVGLVITVDCGITDVAPITEANRLGLEVIVTDHHLVPETLPPAYAIINPKRADDPYPYKMLAGAGVAFKLVQALSQQIPAPISVGWEKWLLDLVAIATVADMVPLTGENRALVYFGLKVLRQTRRHGLRALVDVLKINLPFIAEDDIGFMIGPRLNSASRMSHGDEAYALLTATDENEARRLAHGLESKNSERRLSVARILESVQIDLVDGVLLLGDATWSLGVLGLAASRLAEERRQPVFLWGKNGHGEIKGSCRSDGTVHIVELMKLTDELAGGIFLNYGGHAPAGGFSLQAENLPKLKSGLSEAYARLEKLPLPGDDLYYDLELPWSDISDDTHTRLARLAPFGVDNHKPVFYFPKLSLIGKRFFGNGTKHLELTFSHPQLGVVKAIKFFAPNVLPLGKMIDLLATLEKSYFRSRPELRLRIVDWREVA